MAVRILMIEDDSAYIELIDNALGARGVLASYATDGTEGLRLARLLAPDLILLDIRMPGLDGYEVAAAIRAMPALASTRIVAVTGAARDDPQRLEEAGFDGYFTKPIRPADLVNEIERFLPEPLPAIGPETG